MDRPGFTLASGDNARKLLDSFGFNGDTYEKDSIIVVFNLPKPLVQYWFKGGEGEWGDLS